MYCIIKCVKTKGVVKRKFASLVLNVLICMSVGVLGLFHFLLDFEVVMAMITLAGQFPYIYFLLKVLYPARCCTCMISVAVDLVVPLILYLWYILLC
jgi:hypothetical protein